MTETTDSLTPVEDLLARARAYVTHSHAKNALNAYAADWKHFSAWCDDHKRRALPVSPETILCYVVDLVDRFTIATIDRRLSSIGYYHKQARQGLPTKDPEVERTMRGIRRAKGVAPNEKASILTSLLCRMVAALLDDLPGLRDKAMLLVGFASAFRRSEIVGLQVRDVQSSDTELIITLPRSKTDQEVASFTKGIPIDTLSHYNRLAHFYQSEQADAHAARYFDGLPDPAWPIGACGCAQCGAGTDSCRSGSRCAPER